ncbi:cytochrome P450 6j1-like [Cimex lectularius]|uniref:Cytochrome P450 n=1 Tax=Cimex lectularius TaxID=79782 RepID=A0A8I6TJM5_CIMLE|nr:cytochrome P450 6j1-like [Cimex lectularius]
MFLELLLLVPGIWLFVYFWWTRNYDHWLKKGIPYEKPTFPYGNIKDVIYVKETLGDFTKRLYNNFPNSKIVGFYGLRTPMAVVRDPDIMKDILIKEFNSFPITAFEFNKNVDPMMALNPFGLSGDKWKLFRSFHSQAHTLARLKGMVPAIAKSASNFLQHIRQNIGEELNVRELTRYFAVDAVASCAYTTECNSFVNPDNPFVKETMDRMFTSNPSILALLFAPWWNLFSRGRLVSPVVEKFFKELGTTLIAHRKNNNLMSNDLIQLIISHNEKAVKEGNKPLDETELAATLVTVFLDGTETVSLVLTNVLYLLASHPEVQSKLRQELVNADCSFENDLAFDKINNLEYLDMVLQETLRIHPTIYVITRLCTTDTQLGECKIEKGTKIFIPLTALTTDPMYFPEPDKFIPERFSKEGREKLPKFTHMPFGEGPKSCVGMKYAVLSIKTALINLVLNFNISLSPRHKSKYVLPDPNSSFVCWPKDDTYMKFQPI